VLWCRVLQFGGLGSSEFVIDMTAFRRAYLSRYGHLKAEVTNCTPDDGHVWCPKHVEVIKRQ
jgi:hypothetical protein